jgi:hypothetical protein
MANPHRKCEICARRHAPGKCTLGDGYTPPDVLRGQPLHSLPIIALALTRICVLLEKLVPSEGNR